MLVFRFCDNDVDLHLALGGKLGKRFAQRSGVIKLGFKHNNLADVLRIDYKVTTDRREQRGTVIPVEWWW